MDRAALDAALLCDIDHGGWCPAARRAEDGTLDAKYRLKETASKKYSARTRRNIEEADGTLLVNVGSLIGGTLKTAQLAEQLRKPLLLVQLDGDRSFGNVFDWLSHHQIHVLNVAGPRESRRPGIYALAFEFLMRAPLFGDGLSMNQRVAYGLCSARRTGPHDMFS